jgi:hypothetical protein
MAGEIWLAPPGFSTRGTGVIAGQDPSDAPVRRDDEPQIRRGGLAGVMWLGEILVPIAAGAVVLPDARR